MGKIERNPNVFKNFVCDFPGLIDNCCNFDFEGWKLNRFVKDQEEQTEIRQLVRKEYPFLKDLYLTLSSRSNFPGLSIMDFTSFLDKT